MSKKTSPFTSLVRGLPIAITFVGICFLAIFIALAIVCQIQGLNLIQTFSYFITSTFLSEKGILHSLVKTTPLLIATLGLSVAFSSHVWNIGAEGQMALGIVMTLWATLFLDIPGFLRIIIAIILSFIAGAAWAAPAGYIKAKWNVPEIPITLMQNFVTLALMLYLIANPWKPEGSGYARTAFLPETAKMPFLAYPLNSSFLLALVLIPIVYWLMKKSMLGYKLRATGQNIEAARFGGINTKRMIVLSMAISGGICALAGTALVAGEFFYGVEGMTGGFGFYAIVCVLLARMRPELCLFTSYFTGAIIIGTTNLTLRGVPTQFVEMSVGIIFIASVLTYLIQEKWL